MLTPWGREALISVNKSNHLSLVDDQRRSAAASAGHLRADLGKGDGERPVSAFH